MADDLYAVLGVAKGADADAIKKAYRKLAKDLHPDKNQGNKQSEARFKKVNHAFDTLSDPKKRALYDEFGEEGLRDSFDADRARAYKRWSTQQGAGGGFGGGGGRAGGRGVRLEDLFGGGGVQEGDVGDMFGDLFGRQQSRRRGPTRGSDLESEISIDFASAVKGATIELRPRGPQGDPVQVRIPAGADEGSRVRIPSQGAPSPNGGPAGDLFLTIHVQPHAHFRREDDDLHLDVPLKLAEAFHGSKVKVPTIDGSVTLKVPPYTQSGDVVRLRGKGVARKGREPGDLYVHFQVRVPKGDSPELAAAIDRVAEFQTDDPRAAFES